MAYQKQTWNNDPNGETPITAERLNHIEDGIANASENNYSTEERIVGTWFDGKPLYEKLVTGQSQMFSYSYMGISNVDTIFVQDLIAEFNNGLVFQCGRYNDSSDMFTYYLNKNTQTINVDIGLNWLSDLSNIIVVIRYTKTTD